MFATYDLGYESSCAVKARNAGDHLKHSAALTQVLNLILHVLHEIAKLSAR